MTGRARLMGALRRHPIWSQATDRTVRAVLECSREVQVRAADNILTAGHQAEHIHLLLDGACRVFYPATTQDSEVTVKLFWAPAAFGDAESIIRSLWGVSVEALTPCWVLVIPAPQYFALMQQDISLCFRQYWDVCRRFAVAMRTERAANFGELLERLVAMLMAYGRHFGEAHPRGTLIACPLTQDMIAKQVSSNRRSVVRALKELYDRGLLSRVGRRFLIPNMDELLTSTQAEIPELSFQSDPSPWAVPKR